jgi:hypothetical protein
MNENLIGHKVKLLNSERTGITLELNNLGIENYSVSFDNEKIIERINKKNLSFGDEVSKVVFFKRLIRDIRVSEEKSREFASSILCDFIEFDIDDFDLNILKLGIEKIIEQLKRETNINAEQKLAEGLFEFIWSEKLNKKEELELLERITEIDSYHICHYLDVEDYLKIQKVKEYVEKIKTSG